MCAGNRCTGRWRTIAGRRRAVAHGGSTSRGAATAVPGWGILAARVTLSNLRAVPMLYFAYGSNLDLDQIRDRLPDIRVVGLALLRDHRLTFPL